MAEQEHLFDVFLSYQHNSKPIADSIVATLESNNIRCWYAPRDVRGGYAASIMGAIEECRAFVIILNQESSNSPQVLNEVEAAYGRVMKDGLPIIPFRIDSDALSREMEYYVKRLHWIDASDKNIEQSIGNLMKQLFELLPDRKRMPAPPAPTQSQPSNRRSANLYFKEYGDDASEEARWLHLQNLILKDFDAPIYQRLLSNKRDVAVLDIGCNNAEVLNDRIGSYEGVTHILGIDANTGAIEQARSRFATDSRYTFEVCNCESGDFEKVVGAYLQEHDLRGFSFVNITMTILHLKRPYGVLRALRKYLVAGGSIFIRDIDDGLNVAFPDENGDFARLNDICASLPTTGCRTSGRQIFGMLKRAGFTDITLERSGLSTAGMNHDQRYALFQTCFDWLGGDLELRCRNNPDNQAFEDDRDWFEEHEDELEERFQSSTFFYQEGFMIFTATVDSQRGHYA